jgi:hypothetical protein
VRERNSGECIKHDLRCRPASTHETDSRRRGRFR